jgi:hypothetical protein
MVAEEPHVELFEETSKSVELDVTVILPGAPVKLDPAKFADCDAVVVPTVVDANAVYAAIVNAGEAPEQVFAAVDEFLGNTVPSSKSVLLLFASKHPAFFLKIDLVLSIPLAGNGLVSLQVGLAPYPITSTTEAALQAVVPFNAVLELTNATFPVDPLKLIVVLVKSAVGKAMPVVEDASAMR